MADVRWHMSQDVYVRWKRLLDRLMELHEDTDEAYALRDEARSLPGFPLRYDERNDVIIPVVQGKATALIRRPW